MSQQLYARVDHIYTGRFEETQDRECLLELMALSHRWELGDIQTTAEALLVRTITLGTYHECKFTATSSKLLSLTEPPLMQ